jgi:hypothetical protein
MMSFPRGGLTFLEKVIIPTGRIKSAPVTVWAKEDTSVVAVLVESLILRAPVAQMDRAADF